MRLTRNKFFVKRSLDLDSHQVLKFVGFGIRRPTSKEKVK